MMVFSKASGIMFSVNVADGDDSKIVIDAIYGLGEYVVLGKVTPDHFVIDKETMKIVEKNIIKQPIQLVRVADGERWKKRFPKNFRGNQFCQIAK